MIALLTPRHRTQYTALMLYTLRVPGKPKANIVAAVVGPDGAAVGGAQADRMIVPTAASKCKAFIHGSIYGFMPIARVVGVGPELRAGPLPDIPGHIQHSLRRRAGWEAANRCGATVLVLIIGTLVIWRFVTPRIHTPLYATRGILPLGLAR